MATGESLTIRRAGPGDLRTAYDLVCLLEETRLEETGFQKAYEANLLLPGVFYFLAFIGLEPAGFISLHIQQLLHHAGPVAEIQELIVRKELRGASVGRSLFEKARETAAEHGCVQLEVCCRKERVGSHLFYAKMGMVCSHDKLCLMLSEEA